MEQGPALRPVSAQGGEGGLRRLLQYPEQGFGGTRRASLALFPISNRIQGNADSLGELDLTQTQAPSHATGKARSVQHGFCIVRLRVLCNIRFRSRVYAGRIDTAKLQ